MEEKIVILGAGVSGNGTAILAKKHGYDVFVSDKAAIADGTKEHFNELGIDWEENTHTLSKMHGAKYVMKSPGIPSKIPLIDKIKSLQIPAVSEITTGYPSKFK